MRMKNKTEGRTEENKFLCQRKYLRCCKYRFFSFYTNSICRINRWVEYTFFSESTANRPQFATWLHALEFHCNFVISFYWSILWKMTAARLNKEFKEKQKKKQRIFGSQNCERYVNISILNNLSRSHLMRVIIFLFCHFFGVEKHTKSMCNHNTK